MSQTRMEFLLKDLEKQFQETQAIDLEAPLQASHYLNDATPDERFHFFESSLNMDPLSFSRKIASNLTQSFFNPGDYYKLCEIAIKHSYKGWGMVNVDPNLLTQLEYQIICQNAIEKDITNIKYIQSDYLDSEYYSAICQLAATKIDATQLIGLINPASIDNLWYEGLCTHAMQSDQWSLRYVSPKYIKKSLYEHFCQTACEAEIAYFQYVQGEYLNQDVYYPLCEKALYRNLDFQKFIPYDKLNPETVNKITAYILKRDEETHQTSLQNGYFDRLSNERYTAICQDAVKLNFNYVKQIAISKLTNKKVYAELCQTALVDHPEGFEILNDIQLNEIDDKDFLKNTWRMAVKKNGLALEYANPNVIDDDQFYVELVTLALAQNGLALKYVNKDVIEKVLENQLNRDEQIENLYALAIKQNISAIEYIENEDLKYKLLKGISVDEILKSDGSLHNYLHENPKMEAEVKQFFGKVRNVVAIAESEREDPEVRDSYLVYANKQFQQDHNRDRKDKTTLVISSNLEDVLSKIEQNNTNHAPLNLILLSHFNINATKMADLFIHQICDVLSRHPTITKVTLLGCKTVAAEKLSAEMEVQKRYEERLLATTRPKCGFVLMSRIPSEKDITKILGSELENAYVLIKTKEKEVITYQCMLVSKSTPLAQSKIGLLYETQLKALERELNENKPFRFLKKESGPIQLRSKAQKTLHLTPYQQEEIEDIMLNISRFSRAHPDYKNRKEYTTFLRNIEVDVNSEEKNKLNQSIFITRLADSIQDEPTITQPIAIKGYADVIDVDTREKGFNVVTQPAYKIKPYPHSFFQKNADDNINRQKLADMRREKLEDNNTKGTSVKSITIKVPGKK